MSGNDDGFPDQDEYGKAIVGQESILKHIHGDDLKDFLKIKREVPIPYGVDNPHLELLRKEINSTFTDLQRLRAKGDFRTANETRRTYIGLLKEWDLKIKEIGDQRTQEEIFDEYNRQVEIITNIILEWEKDCCRSDLRKALEEMGQ